MDVLLLANSQKQTGRCIAGYDIHSGKFVRLGHGEHCDKISFDELYIGEKPIDVGDIVRVEASKLGDELPQTENYELIRFVSILGNIWGVGDIDLSILDDIASRCTNKYVFANVSSSLTASEATQIDHSLEFVKVTELFCYKVLWDDGGYSYKCSFRYNGLKYYRMSFTDVYYRSEMDKNTNGNLYFEGAYILVSLPNPFDGWIPKNNNLFYKYVSGVFPLA